MVLCCIPLFAFVLKILYVFKRRFYIEHLIFALHTHAFVFLSTVTIIGISFLLALNSKPLTALVCPLLGVAVFVHLLIALRRVSRQHCLAPLPKFILASSTLRPVLRPACFVPAFFPLLPP